MNEKYRCTYTTGGGTEHEDGIWEKKETPKQVTMTKIKEYMSGVYSMHEVGFKAKVGKGTGNPMEEYEDGTFVVYFAQAGTPYFFETLL